MRGFFAYAVRMTDEQTPDPNEELTALVTSNQERLNRLEMQRIAFPVEQLTLRHIIETLFPTEEERAELNLGFQRKLATELGIIESQLDRINLERSAAEAQQSGLIVPGGVQR